MEIFARWLARHPWLAIAAHAAITAWLGFYAAGVRIDSSLENVLPSGDPRVRYYGEVRATFGSDDVAVIGVRAEDVFATGTLEKIARVTNAVAAIPGVERVLSLTNAPDPAADVLSPPRLLPPLPLSAPDVEALKAKLTARPLYGKNLLSDDFRAAAINVFFSDLSDAEYRDRGIDERIRRVLAAEEGPEELFYTGVAHIKQAAVDLMRRDLWRFTPIALLLIVLVLWLSFRTILGVLLPLLTMLLALVSTLGVMGLAGKPITLGTFILPPLLLVVGSSYAIHVTSRYCQQVQAGVARDELVTRTLQHGWVPLLISAVTTQVGFGSLMVNRIVAIRDLGLFAVVGLAFTLIAALTFLPAVLELAGPRSMAAPAAMASRLSELLAGIGRRAYGARRTILWGAALIALLALPGASRIRVDSDFLTYFEPDSEVRRANEIINSEIVGSSPFYLIVEGRSPGQLRRWDVLRKVKELQQFVATVPGIATTVSIVDWLEMMEAGLYQPGSGDLIVDELGTVTEEATPKPFWEEPRNLEPVLTLIGSNPKSFGVTDDFGKASILVRSRYTGSRDIEAQLGAVRSYIAQHFPPDLRVEPTGSVVLLTGTSSDIVAGQIESLGIALVLIFGIFALMFLSARVGFLAIVPNVLPIVLFFGALGWMGVLLNQGTSLIAAIALGLVVDSTVHYMARLNLELKGETDQAAAITRTTGFVGVPITYATVALFFGFLTFAFSSFVPIQSFGLLSAMTLLTALGANLALLPALLATTKIITLWDLLTVRLGRQPARTIPLLRDLRPAQARIVVLMGEMKTFAPGETIVRRGEQGDAMYVIIEGRTEVWAGDGAERKHLAALRRGDVFGEMALVRRDVRSADVVATEPVEVLALDERFLSRIQSRYPRIAAKVFLNLTRILSDSLQRTTDRYVGARVA
jgi:predicted RND superfamily exporter protein